MSNIKPFSLKAFLFAPLIITILYTLLVILPMTRSMAVRMQQENHSIELLTFLSLLVGGILGLVLAVRTRKHGERASVTIFYTLFSLGLLLIAMEEAAWGQHFFRLEPPDFIENINVQNELTIHNINRLQGHTEFLRVFFGLGGLIGVWISRKRGFGKIRVTMSLLPWFLVISVLALFDLWFDFFMIGSRLEGLSSVLAELNEMIIGITGLLFVWVNFRMLSVEWKAESS